MLQNLVCKCKISFNPEQPPNDSQTSSEQGFPNDYHAMPDHTLRQEFYGMNIGPHAYYSRLGERLGKQTARESVFTSRIVRHEVPPVGMT